MSELYDHAWWVDRLTDAAKRGDIVDVRFGASARQYNPATADQWPAERRIPASALRAVMIGDHTGFDPHGIRIAGARITGEVDLSGIVFGYPLHLRRCRIDHPIDLSLARLRQLLLDTSHLLSLHLDGTTITGGFSARHITTHGEIRALQAAIGGQLILTSAYLNNPQGRVLTLDGANIEGDVFADHITTHGEIRALSATITGQLLLDRAHLNNPNNDVLNLDRATITNGLFAHHITTHGEIHANGATITGQLALTGANLNNPQGRVLSLDRAAVPGGLFADQITVHGEIHANGATITGQLNLDGAHLNNPDSRVLTLDSATITGEVFARDLVSGGAVISDFLVDGLISAVGARFESRVDLRNAKPPARGGLVIGFESATIQRIDLPAHSLLWIDLSQTKITNLVTPQLHEPQYPVDATGWTLGDVSGHIRTNQVAAARWLNRADNLGISIGPQPWHALADVYERNGHPAEARRLRFSAANKVTKNAPWPTKLIRWIYLVVAGHGYYPLLAAVWLVLALLGGVALVGAGREYFIPTDPAAATAAVRATTPTVPAGPDTPTPPTQSPPPPVPTPAITVTGATDCNTHPTYPCLDTFTYALTGVIPAATGITRPDWVINPTAPLWLKLGLPTLRILAWIFTAILLAGVTGLLRKSS